jgi:periplasmic divalent cation tolerance protein
MSDSHRVGHTVGGHIPESVDTVRMTYLAVSVGLPDETDAHQLSRALVEERVAAGTRITSGTSHYRWEGEVHERQYWTVVAFTTTDQLERFYNLVEEYSEDDLPGVTYSEIDASEAYLAWIDEGTA